MYTCETPEVATGVGADSFGGKIMEPKTEVVSSVYYLPARNLPPLPPLKDTKSSYVVPATSNATKLTTYRLVDLC